MYGKMHDGAERQFICNEMQQLWQVGLLCEGHPLAGFGAERLIYYHYDQVGYMRAKFPLLTGWTVQAPVPTTIWITDE